MIELTAPDRHHHRRRHLQHELDRIAELLSPAGAGLLDWQRPVAGCPEWDVTAMVVHLGGVHRMAVQAIRDQRPSRSTDHRPSEGVDLVGWLAEGGASLLQVLQVLQDDPTRAAWSFDPRGASVGWWCRRQVLETLVHRLDLEQTLQRNSVVDPVLAADGVDEVVSVLVPLRVAEGALTLPSHALGLRASDVAGVWSLGDGAVAGEVVGTAQQLLSVLWHRADPGVLRASGDLDLVDGVLRAGLTP